MSEVDSGEIPTSGEYTLEQLRAMVNTPCLSAHLFDYYGAVKQLFAVLTERQAESRLPSDTAIWQEAADMADALEYMLPNLEQMKGAQAVRKALEAKALALVAQATVLPKADSSTTVPDNSPASLPELCPKCGRKGSDLGKWFECEPCNWQRGYSESSSTAPLKEGGLLPCPFCSSRNVIAWGSEKDGEPCWCGFCEKCQSEGPHATTKEDAVRLWDTRHVDTPSVSADARKVIEFAATCAILFAHHRNIEEGDYFRCLRCDGESLHGRSASTGNIEHANGCPVALAKELMDTTVRVDTTAQSDTDEVGKAFELLAASVCPDCDFAYSATRNMPENNCDNCKAVHSVRQFKEKQ